ncbi:Prephenate dehydratase / Arogenate dehydratase [Rhodovastum atsumiense]|uniref:Transporter substrate-binding domain-containing protein n=1 Tax=Rhodovastum atsumiense TaxID=504468 RepID=A0A5M6IMW1_9PROT|nr:transporter substrate-binding domain-containing protein [Rhodovastum atsumiense]KAA5608888.1 transporter substrate-binding domain-containing protein [Rhodovastum atsumiense]CAH2602313.1 Prephenate dehydratase / Arogenate dehydratase [Rhodovastum atsumiense]
MRHLLRPILLALVLAATPLALLPAASTPAHAESSKLDAILARGTIRVGLTGDYRPFSLLDKASGTFEGLDVDMAESLGRALGVKVELVPTTWGGLLGDLAADRFDLAMGGISVTLERQKTAFFSTPLVRTGKAAIARCTDKDRFDSLAAIDRPGVKVLANPGGTNERFDRANLKAAEIVMIPTNTAIFDALVAGKGDVMITDSVETRLQQKLHPQLCAIHPDRPFDFGELAYLLPRDAVLKAWIDQWLHVSQETGEYARLTAKWLQ